MSISSLREELRGTPGAETLVMRYEDGGKVEVYSTTLKTVRVKPGANSADIRAALEAS